MVYSLAYRRPPHVDSARASVLGDEKTKSLGETSMDTQVSGSSGGMSFGIPNALSFDRIINGGTCPVSQLPVNLHPYHSALYFIPSLQLIGISFIGLLAFPRLGCIGSTWLTQHLSAMHNTRFYELSHVH